MSAQERAQQTLSQLDKEVSMSYLHMNQLSCRDVHSSDIFNGATFFSCRVLY
jgi:hypothetical protein